MLFLSTPSARRATCAHVPLPTLRSNFYPRPPRGGRPASASGCSSTGSNFYPRPPRGGRRHPALRRHRILRISIHALREEGDPHQKEVTHMANDFYPRPPRGGRLAGGLINKFLGGFLSTPSARRATTTSGFKSTTSLISIHALREEGDLPRRWPSTPPCRFLSTPSARRATKSERCSFPMMLFLSTPSARRATSGGVVWIYC